MKVQSSEKKEVDMSEDSYEECLPKEAWSTKKHPQEELFNQNAKMVKEFTSDKKECENIQPSINCHPKRIALTMVNQVNDRAIKKC